MKHIYKKIALALLLTSLAFGSCKKNFLREELNDDPTALLNADPKVLLPAALSNMAYFYGGDFARFNGVMMQQVVGSSVQWVPIQVYNFVGSDFNNCWSATFFSVLNNLDKMGAYSKENKYYHYEGVSKVLTAFGYSVLVDHWGDVPFTEALKAPAILQPKYDKGSFVYESLINMLNDAEILLAKTDVGRVPNSDDLLFGGNIDSWIELSHALKARMYLHTKEFSKAKSELILANGVNAIFNFSPPSSGPMRQFNDQRVGDLIYKDAYLFKTLENLGDARITSYVDTAEDDLGPLFDADDQPVCFISSMEQKFIEAEIAARNGDADAEDILKEAMLLSYSFAKSDTNGFSASLAAYPYIASDPLVDRLKSVMMQKYFAMFLQPETFADWRRTGIPALNPTIGSEIPRRYMYPIDEVNTNPNTPSGVNMFSPRVFWDVD